jgi:hypothetical protein
MKHGVDTIGSQFLETQVQGKNWQMNGSAGIVGVAVAQSV